MTREQRNKAYNKVVQIARDNGLILSAAGGVMTLVHPDVQESEGVLDKCLKMSNVKEGV